MRSARDAELNAADQMRYLGYADAKAMPPGTDGGIDVFSKHALAQVKWKKATAGRPDLQRLYGARGAHTSKDLYFFALSTYSKQAIEYANKHHIRLYSYDMTGQIYPQNDIALENLKFAAKTTGQPNQLQAIADMKRSKDAWSSLVGASIAAVVFFFITKAAILDIDWSTYSIGFTVVAISLLTLIDLAIIIAVVTGIRNL